MASALQCPDDAFLVGGRQLGKDGGRLNSLVQLLLVHGFDIRSEQDFLHRQADLPAYKGRYNVVIPGENLYRHVDLIEFANRLTGGFLGWVQKGQIAQQGQVGFVLDGIVWSVVSPRKYTVRQCDDPEPVGIEFPDAVLTMFIVLPGHVQDLIINLNM